MSFFKRADLVISLSLLAVITLCSSSDGPTHCVLDEKSYCSCAMSDNSGRYDLSPLSDHPNPYFRSIAGRNGSEKFAYDPCVPFTINDPVSGKETQCKNVAGCQMDVSAAERKTRYFTVARHFTAEFHFNPSSSQMTVHYTNEDIFQPFTMEVNLVCTPHADTTMMEYAKVTSNAAAFNLRSPHACLIKPSSLSTGSILCIIFSLSFIVYFVGGTLVLVFVQNRPLNESVPPNRDFWLDLPELIRDGAKFAFNGFKVTQPTHQRLGREEEEEDHAYHDELNEEEEMRPSPSTGPPDSTDGFTAVPV
ncbi:uncharacterized protein LOC110990256 [Acanthaster planci]|uniref:Uncharacterized protein LOC110990256 n=1 Tax=Acanthaster planci TaxID=133434 RepID=A0A8B7ZZH7_ACAPL|nr:uncharacterized protein LOC110990256 [Acanthaster planci]